jgi:hypothetical protein
MMPAARGSENEEMLMNRIYVFAAALTLASPAMAGELTGNDDPTPLAGASICMYSGQNDDPMGLDPDNGPGGVSQSYGQQVRLGISDPVEDKFFHPGNLCDPNVNPQKPIGRNRQ